MARKDTVAPKRENKLTKYAKAPFRILCKAKDMYIKSITDGTASKMSPGGPAAGILSIYMPRSFSVPASATSIYDNQETRGLPRAASQRAPLKKPELEVRPKQQEQQVQINKLPRSFTVGIGRIDEEEACEFENETKLGTAISYSRSKSHAAPKGTRFAL